MITPIQISKAAHLDVIKGAFERRELQMFNTEHRTKSETCNYAGPCAVGITLTPEDRIRLDNQAVSNIGSLIQEGIVVVPEDEVQWWCRLQLLHDHAVSAYHAKLRGVSGWGMLTYDGHVEAVRRHIYEVES